MNIFDYVKIKQTGKIGRITDYMSAFTEDHFKVEGSWYEAHELELYAKNDGGKLERSPQGVGQRGKGMSARFARLRLAPLRPE